MDEKYKNRLFAIGRPFSPLYGSLMKLRAFLYKRRFIKQHRLHVPVVSIGNLTMGGTGKTPFAMYLARMLKDRGFNPAIVSRGYHGTAQAAVNIVSNGTDTLLTAEQAGDEPHLMATKLPGTVIATGKKRYLPAAHVVEHYRSDIIVLDDGFQHLGLYRDLDFVLFDIDHFAGNSRVFPGGELREPISALNRCDAFVLTGYSEENSDRAGKIEQLLSDKFPEKRIFTLTRTFSGFHQYEFDDTSSRKTDTTKTEIPANLMAFSGIANPHRFYRMLESADLDIAATHDFRDHHAYQPSDITILCRQAEENGCSAFITTEKDAVKLTPPLPFDRPVFVPVLDYNSHDQLKSFIVDRIT